MSDLISRQAAIYAFGLSEKTRKYGGDHSGYDTRMLYEIQDVLEGLPSAQPDTEKICARIKAEAIKRNVEYMKHGDRYMLGFVDGMRLARRIVDGTIDDPVYFTLSGE